MRDNLREQGDECDDAGISKLLATRPVHGIRGVIRTVEVDEVGIAVIFGWLIRFIDNRDCGLRLGILLDVAPFVVHWAVSVCLSVVLPL